MENIEKYPWLGPFDPSDIPNMNQITIKTAKKLVGEPFKSKNGYELVEIKIPNADPSDTRPWESFVVKSGFVHDNQYGKGVWMKLPEEGTTNLRRPKKVGIDENGKSIWGYETRTVSNTELKAIVERYKEKNRKEECR